MIKFDTVFDYVYRYIEIFRSRKSEIQAQNGRGRNVTSENTASARHTFTSHKARSGEMFIE